MCTRLLVIGAGGHARSVIDVALQNQQFSDIACLDSQFPELLWVKGFPDIPVIGVDADMEMFFQQGYQHIIIALGDNKLRHTLFNKALYFGFTPVNIISSHAIISPRAKLGVGICVMPGAVINANTIIGDNCICNTNCSIDHDCIVDISCHIAPGVTLSGNVKVGNGTQIGTGASVIDQIIIGEWSLVGGGAAVVSDVESFALYCGVPAKKIKDLI